jgi:hypothetical protein
MSDWADTPITGTDIDYGSYKFSSAFGTRATYDSTFKFMDFNMSPNTEVEIWDIQLEQRDHFTSFTNGSRSWGALKYDISSLGMRDAGCISCWILNSQTMIYCRKNGTNDPNNQYLLKVGSDSNDGYKDNITIRIPGNTTLSARVFTLFTSTLANNQGYYDGTRSSYDLGANTWNHFVLQWDKNGLPSGNTQELYINGVLETGGTGTNTLPVNLLTYIQVGNWMDYNALTPCTLFEQLAIHPSKGFSPDIIESWYRSQGPFFDSKDSFVFI